MQMLQMPAERGGDDGTGPADVAVGDTVGEDEGGVGGVNVVPERLPLPPLVEDEDNVMIASGVVLPPKALPATTSAATVPTLLATPALPATSTPLTPPTTSAQPSASVWADQTAPPAPFSGAVVAPLIPPSAASVMGSFDFTPEEVTKTWVLRIMTNLLHAEILALEPEEQAGRVRELRHKNSFDLECKNNLRRNWRLTASMGLQQVTHFLGMKRLKPGKQGRATKRKNGKKND
jgi:hypothetical protein